MEEEEKRPFIILPVVYCPECRFMMQTFFLDDLRIRIISGHHISCSRANEGDTTRPIAQFIQFI